MLRDKKIKSDENASNHLVVIDGMCASDSTSCYRDFWEKRVELRYLIGRPFDEVQLAFTDLINFFKRNKDRTEKSGGRFPQIPDYQPRLYLPLAFAYAFNIGNEQWHELTVDILEPEGKDWILDVLIAQRSPNRKIANIDDWKASWQGPTFYRLAEVIMLEGEAREKALKKYMRRWHDKRANYRRESTRSPDPDVEDYSGQFAFEVAAIVMAFDIDDSGFCEDIYYPKELVEYWRVSK